LDRKKLLKKQLNPFESCDSGALGPWRCHKQISIHPRHGAGDGKLADRSGVKDKIALLSVPCPSRVRPVSVCWDLSLFSLGKSIYPLTAPNENGKRGRVRKYDFFNIGLTVRVTVPVPVVQIQNEAE
jgi:hypothetical protein